MTNFDGGMIEGGIFDLDIAIMKIDLSEEPKEEIEELEVFLKGHIINNMENWLNSKFGIYPKEIHINLFLGKTCATLELQSWIFYFDVPCFNKPPRRTVKAKRTRK